MRFWAVWMTVLAGAFLSALPAQGQITRTPASLAGLHGVFLKVDADNGLQGTMSIRARSVLQKAGVQLVSEADWKNDPGVGLLYLEVNVRCERDKHSCGYLVRLTLTQHVQLTNGRRPTVEATTWGDSYTASTSLSGLPLAREIMAVDAGTLLLGFADNYKAAHAAASGPSR